MEADERTEFRIVQRSDPSLPPFAIYLVTYDEGGQVLGAYQTGAPEGGSPLELQATLRQMCQALDKPVLLLDELVPQNPSIPPEWVERITMAREAEEWAERVRSAREAGIYLAPTMEQAKVLADRLLYESWEKGDIKP